MDPIAQEKVNQWLQGEYDQATKDTISQLSLDHPKELEDSFYRNLAFGTGGLRGLMGVGTNRMNKYTVGIATQGFANYLKQIFNETIRVAIAYDSRNNSRFFAETTAQVFAANGIHVFLFEDLRPTAELSFTIRELGCQGGVVCTASHNPKEYNGYKAYWDDGAQLVAPHDKNVIKEIEKIEEIGQVKWSGGEQLITSIGKEMDQRYIEMVKSLSVYPEIVVRFKDLNIVYTPIHGSGIRLVPLVLKALGFNNVNLVKEQEEPNGNFPTVVYPNPEESEAMQLGLNLAQQLDADILCGTDPDADRLAIGVKDLTGNWVLLNGNQTAALAFNYMLEARKEKGIAKPNDMVITTIVTTPLIDAIAKANEVSCYRVLTGFKWIADLIREKEATENYIIGGEESFGLMIGNKIRDKDGVSAVALLCEMAAYEKSKGRSLYEKLIDLSVQHGLYLEELLSITRKGKEGQQEIAAMMNGFRNDPPASLAGCSVVQLLDYEAQTGKDLSRGQTWTLTLPRSNVLQFILADGSVISARPSGTEPKIKFYFSVQGKISGAGTYEEVKKQLQLRINSFRTAMNL
ncbi:MAG: phospho-sugar mutase [Bacteroidetes bacterium]|nr:phospho-sugar mutase [Bacteroidota bacterium]